MKTFNVVVATKGRATLSRLLKSVTPQLTESDYITVIFDGCQPNTSLFNGVRCNVIIKHEKDALGCWGHGARNKHQDNLPGDYLMHADDDDIYTPGAIGKIRSRCTKDAIYLFQIQTNSGIKIPDKKELKYGNIGTPCGIIPNKPPFPKWEHKYGGDFIFYKQLCLDKKVVFVDEVIYLVNPQKNAVLPSNKPRRCKRCNSHRLNMAKEGDAIAWYCRDCDKRHVVENEQNYTLLL